MSIPAQLVAFLALTYIYGSVIEWHIHKNWMHIKSEKGIDLFSPHILHHQTYPRGRFTKAKSLENRHKNITICLEHTLVFCLPLALLVLPIFPLWSLVLVLFGVGHYFLYNHLHAAMHLGRPSRLPKWYTEICYKIHQLHHAHPQSWFNVSLPGADWIFKTTTAPSWADEKRWFDLKKVMYNPTDPRAVKQDKEIINRLNDCIFPSKYSRVGFVGPKPEGWQKNLGLWISKTIVDLFVGETQIVYLGVNYPEKALYAFSHKRWADVQIIRHHFPTMRLCAAQSVMSFCGGLLGLILGPLNGCFSIAGDGKGTAVKTAIKVLKSEPVGICPEGWAYMDDAPLRPFQNGAVRMALGAGVPIVPVYIKYGHSAPRCFSKLNFVLQCFLNIIDPLQRAGAFIVVGEPYWPGTDVENEVQILYTKVSELEPRM